MGSASAEQRTRVDASLASGRRLLGLRALQYGVAFLSGVTIARALGPEGRATYALALTFAAIVLVASHLSVEFAATRLLARAEATSAELTRVAVTAALVLGGAGMALATCGGLALRAGALGGASATSVVLASAIIPPGIANLVFVAILLRRGQVGAYGLIQAGQAVLQLALLLAVTRTSGLSPEAVLAANLATVCASTLATAVVLARALGGRAVTPSRDVALLLRVMRLGLSLHGVSLAVYLNLRIDLLLVGALLSVRDAGLYSLAVSLAELCALATATLALAALKDQTELPVRAAVAFTAAFTRRTLVYAVGLAVLASAVCLPVIRTAYGEVWTPAALPFALLTLGSVALAVDGPARGLLLRVGRPWAISLAALTATAVNVVANLVLLPRLGLPGAAIASVVSYWTSAGLMVTLLRHELRRHEEPATPRPPGGPA